MSFSLSPENLAQVERLTPRYPERRSALLPILHIIQKQEGHISKEAQLWAADYLGLAPIKVYEVVTFYPFFREHPIGKRYIRVCRTLPCALSGAYHICDRLKDNFNVGLNEISPDGRVTIEFAECLARCGTAPVVMVDDDLYENLDEAGVDALCDKIKQETPATQAATSEA